MDKQTPAIAFRDLTRDFPVGLRGYKLRALEKVSFDIPQHGIYGLLGPNGSGKSTAIKIILGLLAPSAGRCEVLGSPASSRESKGRLGYLPENPHFPSFLSGEELVLYFAGLSGITGTKAKGKTKDVIHLVGLSGAASRKVKTYSKGMLQRIGLAQALVHDPEIIILDEPLSGLDPEGTQEVIDLLTSLRNQKKTILISSHLLSRVEEVCDRIAILHKGRLIKEGKLEDLLQEEAQTLSIQISGTKNLPTGDELIKTLGEMGFKIDSIRSATRPLDQVFLDIVSKDREARK